MSYTVYRTVDAAVNPFTAGWVGRGVRNGTAANVAILANAGATPIFGVVVSAEDKLGGQIGIAMNGSFAMLKLAASGQPDVNESGFLTCNATGYMIPAAAGDYIVAQLAESKAHGVSDLVPGVVCIASLFAA